jgi:hypothetical protein
MRFISLLPLSAMMIAALGCQPEQSGPAPLSIPERDVTRPDPGLALEVASLVELQAPRTHRVVQRSAAKSRQAKAPRPPSVAPEPAAEIVVTSAVAVTEPATTMTEPVSDRELLPGKTITLIPASSGPSTATDHIDEFPPEGRTIVRGGARCPPRIRPGIGIATRPRPSLY